MKTRTKPDSRLQVLREALIRNGLAVAQKRDDHLDWLHQRGYFETFEDANGTPCYRVTDKGLQALRSGELRET